MQTLRTKSLSWHHLVKPSAADIDWLEARYHVHPITLDELTRPTARPRVDGYDGYLYMVLHFPLFNAETRKTYAAEVDFLITKTDLVTVTYESIPPLEDAFKKCTTDSSCEELYASKTPAHLLFYMIKDMYTFALRELDHIQDNVAEIETQVFAAPHASQLVERLATIRRDIIDFRRTIKPQQSTLESLGIEGEKIFGKALRPFFQSLIGEYAKIWSLLENHKEAVDALYDNHVTLLSIKQNEAVKILTIMAFTTFPLMLFAAIFSMETSYAPILGHPYDFWIIIGIMIAGTLAMFAFFKHKKWL